MSPSVKYGLGAAWVLLFAFWMVSGIRDRGLAWALLFLTLAIVGAALVEVHRWIGERVGAMRRGESVLTASTLRGLLIAGLVLGLVLRVVGWDRGDEGVVAWIGGIMAPLALVGLLVLGYLGERAKARNPSFYFDPNWKYGLILACIAALVVAGAANFEGVVTSLCTALFWIALIALVVQTAGRWILRLRSTL